MIIAVMIQETRMVRLRKTAVGRKKTQEEQMKRGKMFRKEMRKKTILKKDLVMK